MLLWILSAVQLSGAVGAALSVGRCVLCQANPLVRRCILFQAIFCVGRYVRTLPCTELSHL